MNCDASAEKSIGYCYNIALKSPEDRHKIQLDLQASKAIYELRKGAKDRYKIECQIAGMPSEDQAYFRERLNFYQGVVGGTYERRKNMAAGRR